MEEVKRGLRHLRHLKTQPVSGRLGLRSCLRLMSGSLATGTSGFRPAPRAMIANQVCMINARANICCKHYGTTTFWYYLPCSKRALHAPANCNERTWKLKWVPRPYGPVLMRAACLSLKST